MQHSKAFYGRRGGKKKYKIVDQAKFSSKFQYA
jgi:hypothetical protein